jgi:hypothetical protein
VTRRRDLPSFDYGMASEKAKTTCAGLWLNPIHLVVKTAWGKELATASSSAGEHGAA